MENDTFVLMIMPPMMLQVPFLPCGTLRMVKQHICGHNHTMNHGKCHFVSRDTYEYVNCEVAMGLVCIRPNRGAEKMEPFIRFLRAHHTHPISSV